MASPRIDTLAQTREKAGERVLQAASGYMISAALGTVARLNIADLLAEGPRPVAELAAETGTDEGALYRVLRALASAGLFAEPSPHTFALTPESETLRTGVPGSTRDIVVWVGSPFHFQVWADLQRSVVTGQPAADRLFGKPCFEVFEALPDVGRDFNEGMTGFSRLTAPALLEAYDFSGTRVLMDVAGGHGHVLAQVLERHPSMRGILFDLESVVEGAKAKLEALNLNGRCRTLSGNFFERIPEGADTYYLQHIIHDWNDETALKILRNCRRALAGQPGGKLLVLDSVLPAKAEPHFGFLLDLEMLLLPGGRERTEPELRSLFERAGLRIERIIPTRMPQSLIEARPV